MTTGQQDEPQEAHDAETGRDPDEPPWWVEEGPSRSEAEPDVKECLCQRGADSDGPDPDCWLHGKAPY